MRLRDKNGRFTTCPALVAQVKQLDRMLMESQAEAHTLRMDFKSYRLMARDDREKLERASESKSRTINKLTNDIGFRNFIILAAGLIIITMGILLVRS